MKFFRIYFALLLAIPACEPSEPVKDDIGYDFFPTGVGHFQVYSVDETIYSGSPEPLHSIYQLKVRIKDSFPNEDGTRTYVLSRMRRLDGNAEWEDVDTWSARINGFELIVNEGNVPFVKLVFPPHDGLTWDGNKFNAKGEDQYRIQEFGTPYAIGGMTFDETLTVEQEMNNDVIVYLDERREVYGRNIGLIYSEITQLSFCTEDHCRGQQQVESGRMIKQELIEYGS